MKKIMLSMLAIAMLASCSKSEEGLNGSSPDARVPIQLGSGVAVISRADKAGPIVPNDDFDAGIAGWEHDSEPDYAGAPLWSTTVSTKAVATSGTAADVTWDDQKYYNADENINTYIKAWYPQGELSTSTVTFTNTDGTVDAMLSSVISGNKNGASSNVLTFEHLTAQLKFTVVKGDGLATGTKIKSITVKGASVPTAIHLAKTPADTDVATWTAVASLAVPNFVEAEIIGTATAAGGELMIQPVGDNTTIKLDVVTSLDGAADVTFKDVEFTTDGSEIERGKAYTIALAFKQSEVTPTAQITEWATAAGSGTVQ